MPSSGIADQDACHSMRYHVGSRGLCDLWNVVSANDESQGVGSLLYQLKSEFAEDNQCAALFIAEGRQAMRIRHPGVANVQDVLIEGSDISIVVEQMRGTTVRQVVELTRACDNSIPAWFAVDVARKVCDGLIHAHTLLDEAGNPAPIYHKHLSVDQVAILDDGSVRIHGFGVGYAAFPQLGDGAAPEQERASRRRSGVSSHIETDIAGAAGVLHSLLSLVVLDCRFQSDEAYQSGLPREVDRGQTGCLEHLMRRAFKQGGEPFSSVAELRGALDACLAEPAPVVRPEHLAAFINVLGLSNVGNDRLVPTVPNNAIARLKLLSVSVVPSTSKPPIEELDWDSAVAKVGGSSNEGEPVFFDEEFDAPPSSTSQTCAKQIDSSIWTEAHSTVRIEALASVPQSAAAIACFEEGIARMRAGDEVGAEAAWRQSLLIDPEFRAANTNLRLLKKRRERAT